MWPGALVVGVRDGVLSLPACLPLCHSVSDGCAVEPCEHGSFAADNFWPMTRGIFHFFLLEITALQLLFVQLILWVIKYRMLHSVFCVFAV